MRLIIYILVIAAISAFQGCKFGSDNNKSAQSNDTLNVDKFELKRGENLNNNDWNCVTVRNDIICSPSTWKPVKQNQTHYFSYLDNNDINTFFTIVNYDITKDKIDAKDYLMLTYSQLVRDTIEKFTNYAVKELIFSDKKTWYGEYYTTIQNQEYLTYSMVFEKDGLLYDIVLKLEKSKSAGYKDVFSNILFNIRINGKPVFDENDKLEKIVVVDLAKI